MATQVDLGKIRPVWKGNWAASTAYEQNDMVKVGPDSYICTAAHTSGSTFSDTNWDTLAVGAELPSQTGNSGLVLKTDGSNLSWGQGGGLAQTATTLKTNRSSYSGERTWRSIMSCSITPTSASSKIIVQSTLLYGVTSYYNAMMFKMQRNSSDVAIGDYLNACTRCFFGSDDTNSSGNGAQGNGSILFIDEPNTTSAVTYTLYGGNFRDGENWYINGGPNTNDLQSPVGVSSIVLTEVLV
jgi:hypothetical protein